MSTENKISEEQLLLLRSFTNYFNNAKAALGEASLAYEKAKESILTQVKNKDVEFKEFQKELQNAYGSVNISIDTGIYTPIESTNTNKEVIEDRR
jgi:hypothetical protein